MLIVVEWVGHGRDGLVSVRRKEINNVADGKLRGGNPEENEDRETTGLSENRRNY